MNARGTVVGLCATVVALVVMATPAFAHVSVETSNARPGAESEYTISVPNESESADTTLIEVQLPAGLEVTGFRPGKGWKMRVESEVLVIDGGKLPVGERREFRFIAINPRDAGELEFPAIQTYSDGEEVRWVGAEGSDHPAARVTIAGKPVAQATEAQPEPSRPTRTEASEPTQASEPAEAPQPSENGTAPAAAPSEEPAPASEPGSGVSTLPVVLAIIAAAIVAALVVASGRRNRN